MTKHRLCITLVVICLLGALTLQGQQAQQSSSAKRKDGDVLHYQIRFEGGQVEKLTEVHMYFSTNDRPQNQPGLNTGFYLQCAKSGSSPNVYDCSGAIPNTVMSGSYTLAHVNVFASPFNKAYDNLSVPVVQVENRNIFIAPTKVIVTEQP